MTLRKGDQRLVPYWVQATPSKDLHAIALRFNRDRKTSDLTERQEWLFDWICIELGFRRRLAIASRSRYVCSCELCFEPFPGSEGLEQLPESSD